MKRLNAYLRLCRLPAVFTALADICMGYLLTHAAIVDWLDFSALLGASAGLYLAGMVFNDVFDVRQDRVERPHRPIPSGAVSVRQAAIFGTVLMLAGVVCAAAASLNSLLVAALLATTVLTYDRILKRTALAPLGMGVCRLLNVLLGASSSGVRLSAIWQLPQIWVAVAMGVYITGVTWFARKEAGQSSRGGLTGALAVVDAGLLMLAAWVSGVTVEWGFVVGPGGVKEADTVLIMLFVIFFVINRRCARAIGDPSPARVQPAVGTMLLSIIMIDATLIYFKLGPAGTGYAIATAALIVPAIALRRWIPLT